MCKYCDYNISLHYLLNNADLFDEAISPLSQEDTVERNLNQTLVLSRTDIEEEENQQKSTEIDEIKLTEISIYAQTNSTFEISDSILARELKSDRIYTAKLINGEPLPDWILLDSNTGSLTFEAESEEIGNHQVLIEVEDSIGQTESFIVEVAVNSQAEAQILSANDQNQVNTTLTPTLGNSDFNIVEETGAIPQITIADAQITDSSVGRELVFTVTLDTPSDRTVTVDYVTVEDTAKEREDYIAASGTITFEPGETKKTIAVNTTGTSYLDADENLLISLSNSQNAIIEDSEATGTILPAYAGIRGGSRQQETVTFSFFDEDIFGQGGYDGSNRESNAREPSEVVKANYRQIFDDLNTLVDREFIEVAETESEWGNIRIVISDGPSYAYAGGHIHLAGWAAASDAGINGWESPQGVYGYSTLLHELGHAIGMPHSFGKKTSVFDPEESAVNTVMSYTYPGARPATFMSYDIKSLQERYGAAEYRAGDTMYEFVTVDNYLVDGEIAIDTTRRLKQTIWDSDGIDTFDFSGLAIEDSGYRFDLNQSKYQTTQTGFTGASYERNGTTYKVPDYGTSIAIDVEIENLINSSSDDLIIANSAANIFSGYAPGLTTGNDVLIGTDELDTLDLSEFSSSDISQTKVDEDLKIQLSSANSVTIENYYFAREAERIDILLDRQKTSVDNISRVEEEDSQAATDATFDAEETSQNNNNNALPNISIEDAGILASIPVRDTEDKNNIRNSTGLLFKVSLDAPSNQTVKVDYHTEDGSAKAGEEEDYLFKNKTLTFQPGETEKNIFVDVVLDDIPEADEELFLVLDNAKNAVIADDRATGTIEETRSLSVSNIEVSEDGTEALFTVSLDKPSVQGVFVSYATEDGSAKAGEDYTETEGRLFIKAGETSATVAVPIIDNKLTEDDETFFLNLSEPNYVLLEEGRAEATIVNDDSTLAEKPGGIYRNLQLWIKSDAVEATEEQKVTRAIDNSQLGLDLVPTTADNRPILDADELNYNPVLSFDGEDLLETADTLPTNFASNSSVFVVTKSESQRNNFLFTLDDTGYGRFLAHLPWSGQIHFDAGNTGTGRLSLPYADSQADSFNTWHFSSDLESGQNIFRNGLTVAIDNDASTPKTKDRKFQIGRQFEGDIAEVIVFNEALDQSDRQAVDSYLATKYGFTIDQTTPHDYINSESAVIWSADLAGSYKHDIAGIAIDSNSGLSQLKSRSSNQDSIITLENASDLQDGEALFWSNSDRDNGDRIWQVQEQGDVGTVSISFDLSQLGQQVPIEKYALQISDRDNFDSSQFITTGRTIEDDTLSFTGIDFQNVEYFTLNTEYTEPEPPVVEPPVVEPPVVEPPVVEPPVVEPPVVEPPVVEPPVVEPPVVEPPVVEPPVVEPPVVEPPVVEPPVVEPPVVEPPVVEPPVVEEPPSLELSDLKLTEVHRFYNYQANYHFYSLGEEDSNKLSANDEDQFNYEGESFSVLASNVNNLTGEIIELAKPVYQFFNNDTEAHLFTISATERNYIINNLDNYDSLGIAYYAFETDPEEIETVPIYRLLNRNTGTHLLTSDRQEVDFIQNNLSNFNLENNSEAVFYALEL